MPEEQNIQNTNQQKQGTQDMSLDSLVQEVPTTGGLDFSKISLNWNSKTPEPHKNILEKPVEAVTKTNQATPIAENSESIQTTSPDQSANIMHQANVEESTKEDADEISMDKLKLEKEAPWEIGKIRLGHSHAAFNMLGKKRTINYRTILSISFLLFGIGLVASLLFHSYQKYIDLMLEPIATPIQQDLIQKISSYEQFINDYIHLNNYYRYQKLSLDATEGKLNILNILSADDINYLHKKQILQEDLGELTESILTTHQWLDILKQNITKYGFLSQDIYDLMQLQEQVMPIKKSLLSLEVIKFSSAVKVFSYLDTFINNFANTLHISTQQVQDIMQSLAQRGEQDIYLYLNTCYLNPFERDYSCDLIGDFDSYYDLFGKQEAIDKNFFKKMMQYIDLKLEQTEVPSFSIVFKKFDPSQKQIIFTIDVNTFKQDEIALAKQNIINPHIFVVTKLLNLLKQSMFIVWKSIDVRQLRVEPQFIQIGSTTFEINHSQMSFTLPIQQPVQREIFDFSDQLTSLPQIQLRNITSSDIGDIEELEKNNRMIDLENKISLDTENKMKETSTEWDEEWKVKNEKSENDTTIGKLVERLLDSQKHNASIQFQIQEQSEEKILQNWTQTLQLGLDKWVYNQQELLEVISLLEQEQTSQVITPVMLLRENESGQPFFDILLDKSIVTSSPEIVETSSEENSVQEGGFWDIRSYFEQQ